MEDRIVTKFNLGYKAINSKGKTTIEISSVVKIYDQSPESASAHLISTVTGLLGPAQKQITKV